MNNGKEVNLQLVEAARLKEGGKRRNSPSPPEEKRVATPETVHVDGESALLRIKKNRSEGGAVAIESAGVGTLTGISPEGVELFSRVRELEREGRCEPGLTAGRVLRSLLISEELRCGEIHPHQAAVSQLRLGMPRLGAESPFAADYIRRGKHPPRLVVEYIIGTAGDSVAVGASWFRGYGDVMEVEHVGDHEFDLPKDLHDFYSTITGFAGSEENSRVEFIGDDFKDVTALLNSRNLEFTDFTAICINHWLEDLYRLPNFMLPFGKAVTPDDVDFIAGLPLTIHYTTKPHAYELDTPWGPVIGSGFTILDYLIPERIEAFTGLPVHSRQRQSDMAVGNSGAPLANGQDERELPPVLRRHGFTVGVSVNGGGQTNAHGMNLETGASAGDDLSIAAAALNEATAFTTGLPMDRDGFYAKQGEVIPELLERWVDFHMSLLRQERKSGREDWKKIMPLLFQEFSNRNGFKPADIIATVSRAVSKCAVISIAERLVPRIGKPQYCLMHGGLFKHPTTRQHFESDMREFFDTHVFETYPELHPRCDMGSKELILCGMMGQEGTVGGIFHSIATGKNKTILGTTF